MLRRTRRQTWAALIGLAGLSCLSPTLPLPPPSHPEVTGPDASGQVRLTGDVLSHSQALAINLRTDEIAGQNTGADGKYDFTIGAQVGDELSFFYLWKTRSSSPINVIVRKPPP